MSNRGLIIEERSPDIGDFIVGKLIPFRKKRRVGPFIFIDHMGPDTLTSLYGRWSTSAYWAYYPHLFNGR